MYIKLLWSVHYLPAKYKTMKKKICANPNDRLHIAWTNGAVAFQPIWDQEIFEGAKLPYLKISGVVQIESDALSDVDPALEHIFTLPTDQPVLFHTAESGAELIETYPNNRTPLINYAY